MRQSRLVRRSTGLDPLTARTLPVLAAFALPLAGAYVLLLLFGAWSFFRVLAWL